MTVVEGEGTGKYEHVSIDLSNPTTLQTLKTDKEHFSNFYFENVEQLSDYILDYHSKRDGKEKERIREVRRIVAGFATSYLEKMGSALPDKKKQEVLAKIEIMRNSDPDKTIILMSAHQPNLFAYPGVLRKIALLKAVEKQIEKKAKGMNVICFYGFADHDFVNNKWVRSAEMSAPLKRNGLLRFNIDIDKNDITMPSNTIPKPSSKKLEHWRSQVMDWISENSALAGKYAKQYNLEVAQKSISDVATNNFEDFWKYVERADLNATSLADFSSFVMASLVNSALDSPVVFANFSDCYTAFGKEYKWLFSNIEEYSNVIEKNEVVLKNLNINSGLSTDISELLPVWIKCSCGSKYRVSSSPSMTYYGKCLHCDKEVLYTQQELAALIESSPHLFEPRSISMPLAFARAMDISCYVGGIGGLGYLMHSRAISEHLNSPFPPTPFWQVHDNYIGIETLASTWEARRISASYGLSNLEHNPQDILKTANVASAELNGRMKDGKIPKTAISERERQLLEQIPQSLKISSCAVGYAINIGIGSTYEQWVTFLNNGGALHSPVNLKSVLTA